MAYLHKNDDKCKTPDAIYCIRIHERTVGCDVSLPMNLSLTEEQAKILEDRIHDAMEDVLAGYFNPDMPPPDPLTLA